MNSSNGNVIHTQGLSKAYKGVKALDGLNLLVPRNKYTTIFYSTHILEDVQRVSDTVAILNHGHMVAEAPIFVKRHSLVSFFVLAYATTRQQIPLSA